MAVKYYISSNKYSLQERVTKKHGKVYDIRFNITTLDGVEKQKHIGGFESKTLAKQGYLDFTQKYCECVRNNPIKKKNQVKEKLIIGDLIRQYMATLGNQNKYSVIYDKNNIFRIFILPRFENTQLDKLTKEELYSWQDELWTTKNSKTGDYFSYKYLIKIRGQFSTFLSWCEKRYGVKNLFTEMDKPKRRTKQKEMKFWTKEQFQQFIAVVDDDPTYHALFTFMFYTGRRKGELFALTPADVKADSIVISKSLTRKTIDETTYAITPTKTYKVQTLPVCDIVKKEIAEYKGGTPFYFGGEKPLADNTVRRKFIAYTKKAGLPQIRIHDLRHSFTSMAISLGANLMVVSELIGDTVEQVMQTYGHLIQGDLLNIIKKIK